MSKNVIKILGISASLISMSASLITDWVYEKKMDEKIEQKIIEALSKR